MSTKVFCFALVLVLLGPLAAFADDDDDNDNKPKAVPFAFIGTAEECGGPAGARIATAVWLGGMGLPDNGGPNSNATTPSDPPNKKDRHLGLLLNKNGETEVCSAAGAEIKRFKKQTITELGFDFRKGGHCGAGAPRFNLTSDLEWTYFAGCAAGSHTLAPQDPEWERVRFGNADVFPASPIAPPFVFGVTIVQSIAIVYDEGTDTANNDTEGVGLAVIDNIDINGREIRKGSGIADGIDRDNDGRDRDRDRDDD